MLTDTVSDSRRSHTWLIGVFALISASVAFFGFLADGQAYTSNGAKVSVVQGQSDSNSRYVFGTSGGNNLNIGTFTGSSGGDMNPSLSATLNKVSCNGGQGVFVQMLDGAGELSWVKTFGAGDQFNSGTLNIHSATIDSSGNIYLGLSAQYSLYAEPAYSTCQAGGATALFTRGFSQNLSYWVIKLDSSGTFQWLYTLPYDGNHPLVNGYNARLGLDSIAVDGSGNVYAGGTFSGFNLDFDPANAGTTVLTSYPATYNSAVPSDDPFIIKLDSSGTVLWGKNYGGAGFDGMHVLKSGPGGSLYAGGFFANNASSGAGDINNSRNSTFPVGVSLTQSSSGGQDGFLMRLDSSGVPQQTKRLSSTAADFVGRITLSGSNIFVVGTLGGATSVNVDGLTPTVSPAASQPVVWKLTDSGSMVSDWANGFTAPGTSTRTLNTIDVDSSGNIYLGGSFTATADLDLTTTGTESFTAVGARDAFFSKYDSSFNYQWTRVVTGALDEEVNWIDNKGGFFVAGYFKRPATTGSPVPTPVDLDTGVGVAPPGFFSSSGDSDSFVMYPDSNGYTVSTTTVTSMTANGSTAGGTVVTIAGNNLFGATVTFDGVPGTNVTQGANSLAGAQITVVAPARAAGTVDVVVTANGGTVTRPASFTYWEPPVITSISPNTGTQNTTRSGVVISGSNLDGTVCPSGVTIGGTAVTACVLNTSSSPQTLTVTAPSRPLGQYNVVVTAHGGSTTVTNGFEYVVPPPTISSISAPNFNGLSTSTSMTRLSATASNPPTLTINGTNLANATVTIAGVAQTRLNAASTTTSFTIAGLNLPQSAISTTAPVVVTTASGTANSTFNVTAAIPYIFTNSQTITFTDEQGNTVTSASPYGGTRVSMTDGSNRHFFNPAVNSAWLTTTQYSLTVNRRDLTNVVATANGFTGVLPMRPCTVATFTSSFLNVANSDGSVNMSNTFMSGSLWAAWNTNAPVVTSISPASGRSSGGATVTITGTDLECAQSVRFGGPTGATATIVSASPTELVVTSPARSVGDAVVYVGTQKASATYNSSATASTTNTFVYVDSAINPSVSTVNAVRGTAITPVTMTPSGFTGTPSYSVTSGALPAGLSIDQSTGAISGTPTANQSAANVTVTASDGSSTATATVSFAVGSPNVSVTPSTATIAATRGSAITAVTMSPAAFVDPVTFAIAPALPPGMSFSTATGSITGTPTEVQVATNYTVTANDGTDTATTTVAIGVTKSAPAPANRQLNFDCSQALSAGSVRVIAEVGDTIELSLGCEASGSDRYALVNSVAGGSVAGALEYEARTGLPNVSPSSLLSGERGVWSIDLDPTATSVVRVTVRPQVNGNALSAGAAIARVSFSGGGSFDLLVSFPLEVTASSHTITAGDPVPTMVGSPSIAGVGRTGESCTTTYTTSSAAGTYPVTCSGGTASGYSITYVAGSITASAAPAASRVLAAPIDTTPTLVTASNAALLQADLGEAEAYENGVPVTVDVISVPADTAEVAPEDRTPQQVAEIQQVAQQIEDDLNALAPNSTLGVRVENTTTGAEFRGFAVYPDDETRDFPIPVENVVVIKTPRSAVVIGGIDPDLTPSEVSPSGALEVTAGGDVTAALYGYPSNANGEIVMMSTPILLGNIRTGSDGSFVGQVSIPSQLGMGDHTIVLTTAGRTTSMGFKLTPRLLPKTGWSSDAPTNIAIWLTASGVFLAVTRRRRQGLLGHPR